MKQINTPFSPRRVCHNDCRFVCLLPELNSIRNQLQHPLVLSVVILDSTRECGWNSFGCAIQYCCIVQCDWACRLNSDVCELRKIWNVTYRFNWRTCIWHTVQHLQVVVLRRGFNGIDIQTVGFLIIRHFPAFIADYANRGQYTDE